MLQVFKVPICSLHFWYAQKLQQLKGSRQQAVS